MKESREEAIASRKGLILYKGEGDHWMIRYPDGAGRSGSAATTIKVMNLIYHLGRGKSLVMARKMTFGESDY